MDSPVSMNGWFDLINQPVDKVGKVSGRIGSIGSRLNLLSLFESHLSCQSEPLPQPPSFILLRRAG